MNKILPMQALNRGSAIGLKTRVRIPYLGGGIAIAFHGPRSTAGRQMRRDYALKLRSQPTLPDALKLICYACEGERKMGERGSFVLEETRWCCDACAADNRAAIKGETAFRRGSTGKAR